MKNQLSAKFVAEHSPRPEDLCSTRREFLCKCGMGFGGMGLATLLGSEWLVNTDVNAAEIRSPLAPKLPHFPVKAKHVIHIFAEGGPSHVDTWDPKPALTKYADKSLPDSDGVAFPSPFEFTKRGKSGIEVSSVFPKLGEMVDEMTIIRSMFTDVPAHDLAQRIMNTG